MRSRRAGTKREAPAKDDQRFDAVAAAFDNARNVTRETRKGFGSGALKVDGKIFAMIASKGEFVVKLPKSRVDALVADGIGKRFEPGPGRVMKEWLAVAGSASRWVELAKEAYRFVKAL